MSNEYKWHIISRDRKAKESKEADTQRTSNLKEVGTIGKRFFLVYLALHCKKPDFAVHNLPAIFENGKTVASLKLTPLRRLLLENEDLGSLLAISSALLY